MEPLYGVQMRDKGVIVWEGRKCHADWHCHSQPWNHFCSENSLCVKARKSRIYLMVTEDGKAEERMCSLGE